MKEIKPFVLDITLDELQFIIQQFEILETTPAKDFAALHHKSMGSIIAIKYRKKEAEKRPIYKIKHQPYEALFVLKYLWILQQKQWAEWQTRVLDEKTKSMVRFYQSSIA